jgi:hypothetical protein
VCQIPDAVDTVVCAPDDGCKYHPKHVEQSIDINILCNVASCWIYTYIGILLGAHPILHISRIRVNPVDSKCFVTIETDIIFARSAMLRFALEIKTNSFTLAVER